MKMNRWSEHEKYIVMLTGAHSSVTGVRLGYQAFLDYRKVKEALIVISKSGDSYSYDGNIYSKSITSSRATQILMKLEEAKWDDDIIIVAKQIGADSMLSPRR